MSSKKHDHDVPLVIASRWNHPKIVYYLLSKSLYNQKTVNYAFKLTTSSIVQNILNNYMVEHGYKKGKFCECYCMCKISTKGQLRSDKVQPSHIPVRDYRDQPMNNVIFFN